MGINELEMLSGVTLKGHMNVDEPTVVAQIESAIRRGLTQVAALPQNPERVALVGSGPSLQDPAIERELRERVFAGAKLVTVNGAYGWAIERNFRPSAQIVMDARAGNARFLQPEVPGCRYFLASQCHPDLFDAVEGREWVAIFHGVTEDAAARPILDRYYLKRWCNIGGGTTVGIRAIGLLRTIGYRRFDLFGMDSCLLGSAHHAIVQPENDADPVYFLRIIPHGGKSGRIFRVTAWHVRQLEDFLQLIRDAGDGILLNVHGDGLLAYALRASGEIVWQAEGASDGGSGMEVLHAGEEAAGGWDAGAG